MDAYSSSDAKNHTVGAADPRASDQTPGDAALQFDAAAGTSTMDDLQIVNMAQNDAMDGLDEEDLSDDDDEYDELPRRKGGKVVKVASKARNREHAKNTRQRKKNYIESLKDSIKKLEDEREKSDRDRKIALSRFAEQVIDVVLSHTIHSRLR